MYYLKKSNIIAKMLFSLLCIIALSSILLGYYQFHKEPIYKEIELKISTENKKVNTIE